MLAAGLPQSEIATKLNISDASVSNIKQGKCGIDKEKVKEIIESLQMQIIQDGAKKTVANHIKTIERAHEVLHSQEISNSDLSKYKALLELADRKEYRIGTSTGIWPSPRQNLTLISILNEQNNIYSSEVQALLAKHESEGVDTVELGLDDYTVNDYDIRNEN